MTRRNLLQLALASAANLFWPALSAKAGPETTHGIILCLCTIAGFPYYSGPALLPSLREGQMLILRREPENPYDSLAIAIDTGSGAKLGYLPRELNMIPANLMDDGRMLTAEVAEINFNASPWEAVVVAVGLMG